MSRDEGHGEAPGWPERRGTALLTVVGLSFAALMLQCCAGCPLGIAEGALRGAGLVEEGGMVTHPLALALTSIFALGTVLVVGARLARRPLGEQLALRGFDPLLLPALVPAVVGAAIFLMELGTLVEMVLPMPDRLREIFEGAFGGAHTTLGSWVLAVLVAPVMEELVFRGLLLRGLMRRWPALPAVAFTALLFALFHANPWQLLSPLILGLFFGWLTVRTRSLWPAMLAHALNNAVALIAMQLLKAQADADAPLPEPSLGPLWLDLTGLCCLVVGFGGLVLVMRRGGGAADSG